MDESTLPAGELTLNPGDDNGAPFETAQYYAVKCNYDGLLTKAQAQCFDIDQKHSKKSHRQNPDRMKEADTGNAGAFSDGQEKL